MAILVTGGAGYIGSHTCSPESLRRVAAITGATPLCVEGDLRDAACLARLFAEHEIEAVIHFAGLKAVGESVAKPLLYYDNNVVGTIRLLEAMRGAGVRNLVFSSSATVYGDPQRLPLTEDHPLSATNAYGQSKLMIEEILRDVARSEPGWRVALLRYFNPVGAHKSGTIGEDPQGIPNNLMPFVAQVAVGVREKLSVFGADYPTPDGTGVRDYIHVVDLALGHLRALERLRREDGLFAVNLGTGIGYSVLDMVRAFEAASGRKVAYQVVDRRPGDIASCYADPSLALELLGWRATRGIDEMCADAWRWQSRNPAGFRSAGA